MAEGTRAAIEKLNNVNYQVWKFKLELLLIKEDLWDVVSEPKPEPATSQWLKKDGKARATIGLLVEDNQLAHIRKVNTAREVWEALRRYHEKSSLTNKVFMLKRLCSMKLDESGDMESHLDAIFNITDKLTALGESLPDHLLIAFMLCSLPDSYSTLVTALETRPEEDLTPELVKGKLINEYKRRLESVNIDMSNTALKATSTPGSRQTGRYKKQFDSKQTGDKLCFHCKLPGHRKRNCWKLQAEKKIRNNEQKANRATNVSHSDTEVEESHVCFGVTGGTNQHKWYVDSGATCHMSNSKQDFVSFSSITNDKVYLANGSHLQAKGTGNVVLECLDPGNNTIELDKVLFIPDLETNLLSVRQLMDKGFKMTFEGTRCNILKDTNVIATADTRGHLYELNCTQRALKVLTSCKEPECIHIWHRRFGHRSPDVIKEMASKNCVNGLKITTCGQVLSCEDCIKGKFTRRPFPKKSLSRATKALELVHTDICGPMPTPTPGGKRYFMTVIDDFSRFTIIYFLSSKTEAAQALKDYVQLIMTQFNCRPKVIRSDGGGEYTSTQFRNYLSSGGVVQQVTVPYSPQQNGVSERKNRSLCEMARCMLADANLDNKYWGEAISTANYLQNRTLTKACQVTPYELWHGKKPNITHLKIFGTTVYAHVPKQKRNKLSNVAKKYVFVGYMSGTKGYRLLDTSTNKIYISRDVKFMEDHNEHSIPTQMVDAQDVKSRLNDSQNIEEIVLNSQQDEYANMDEESCIDIEPKNVPRRSQRSNKGELPKRYVLSSATYDCLAEPKTRKEAMNSESAQEWKKAMDDEMKSLQENEAWTLVPLPSDRKAIGSKWVFKIKQDANGKTNKFKARLVAQGFGQVQGHDYDEVYAPVAKNNTLRILLTIAGNQDMIAKHFDIKSAFLNGKLDEEVYMRQPDGYVETGKEGFVCHLDKSLYGLKQSAKSWNDRLHQALSTDGFSRSNADPCLYMKNKNGFWIYILVYVDDLLVISKMNSLIEETFQALSSEFETCNLGNLSYYLGIQVKRDGHGIFYLGQQLYIDKLLSNFGMKDAKPSTVPLDPGYAKQLSQGTPLPNNEKYRQAIGGLLYLAVNTRPDISASVSILSRRISSPTTNDWCEVKRVLRYLKGTRALNLKLGDPDFKYGLDLVGFADADWGGNANDRKSNSGYVFAYCGAVISWCCRRQSCVSLSSTEAEYVALCEAGKEAKWLRTLLNDLHLNCETATTIYEDNQSCIKLLENDKSSNRTKHIDVRYHFVRELNDKKEIGVKYCPTEIMIADALTKPLQSIKIIKLRELMGLC